MLFSVVVPMYNVQSYARDCIESVLNQSFDDYELILVDDGSTDGTAQTIDYYAKVNSHIKVIHKPNGGLVSARKAGIRVAQGEYVVVLDGDDWLECNVLRRVADTLEQVRADMVIFGHRCAVSPDNIEKSVAVTREVRILDRRLIEKELMPNLFPADRKYQCLPYVWGKAFKRELYTRFTNLVDDRITMGEDGVVTYPSICAAQTVCLLPDILYNYRINPNSITRSKTKYLSWESALLRIEHYKEYLPRTEEMDMQICRFAVHSLFNVVLSHMKNEPYGQVRSETGKLLQDPEIAGYIERASFSNNPKESLAKFALKHRMLWLIKLYSRIF